MDSPHTTGTPAAAPIKIKVLRDARGNVYEPAIGPRLKVLLALIFAAVGLLGATGAYLIFIRALNWLNDPKTYTTIFTIWMFTVHVAVGLLIALPFLVFGFTHLASARHRKNRLAVRLGITLFITGILTLLSGLALNQFPSMPQIPTETLTRVAIFWLHVLAPVVAVVLYVLHRRAGPDIKWSWGYSWGAAVGAFVVVMFFMHSQDPQKWGLPGPKEGEQYFFPAEVHTADGKFIPAGTLMMDKYCMKCHEDIYNDHFHSAHKFSSFNNPAYLFSINETREVALKRDGNVKASRWCAGCHDPVPFFSGKFDDPNYDILKDPTAHAGITCTVCHAITNIDSTVGNGSFTIDTPPHYPFAFSDNDVLQWINNQLVKAKPDFHKRTFLKPFHKKAEFCATCHKVSVPKALNHYKEWLRGQNHYDTYFLSGVSGVGARSFYYPPVAKTNCAECHMPLKESNDFGSRIRDKSGKRKIHDHLFPAANTGLFYLLEREAAVQGDPERLRKAWKAHADFLRGTDPKGSDQKVRIDLFGLKDGGTVDDRPVTQLRPQLPPLTPGRTYLIEVVLRTVNMGHPFPQGTADSNEIWVEFTARSGSRTIGRSGQLSGPQPDVGPVNKKSHFVNMLVLDRDGKRIDRRNPQDIYTPLYDHQIPPGAGQVVHYRLTVPPDVTAPVELRVRLRYRKFDFQYMSLVYRKGSKSPPQRDGRLPELPIIDMAADRVVLPVRGVAEDVPAQVSPIKPAWQRWNDYGIGCFLEGTPGGNKVPGQKQEGNLAQAERAFTHLIADREFAHDPAARGNGYANRARVYNDVGKLRAAAADLGKVNALNQAQRDNPPVPWWTVAWIGGLVDTRNEHWDAAIAKYEKILDPANQPRERKFDFTRDYIVINALAKTLFERALDLSLPLRERDRYVRRAVEHYERTLRLDPENLAAHIGLKRCYAKLGNDSSPDVDAVEGPADRDALMALGRAFADDKAELQKRLQTTVRLAEAIRKVGRSPTPPNEPKGPVLRVLRKQCRAVYRSDDNPPELRAAAAWLLSELHTRFHAIYKPDENAKEVRKLYFAEHEALRPVYEAPVAVYPLNGPGAEPYFKE
jgi:tetratricopeptide (TPR) repeat protein